MPFKNPTCRGTKENPHYAKMRHHKWIKFHNYGSYGAEIWEREVICPKCGRIRKDWKARWGHKK